MSVVNSFLVHKVLGGTLTQWAFRKEQIPAGFPPIYVVESTINEPCLGEGHFQGGLHVHMQVPALWCHYWQCNICYACGVRK